MRLTCFSIYWFQLLNLCILAFSCSAFSDENPTQKEVQANIERLRLIAKSILEPEAIVVIAETRLDNLFKKLPDDTTGQYSTVTRVLDLTTMFPISEIRGSLHGVEMFWLQHDKVEILRRRRTLYHLPSFASQGVWLCFLRPIQSLPEAMRADTSNLSSLLNSTQKSSDPYLTAEKMGFSNWLNIKTWFQPAFDCSVFRTAASIRDIQPPKSMDPYDVAQHKEFISNAGEIEKRTPRDKSELILSSAQLVEILKLVDLFRSRSNLPSANDLAAMKSEFSDAILRQLAETSSGDLSRELLNRANSRKIGKGRE